MGRHSIEDMRRIHQREQSDETIRRWAQRMEAKHYPVLGAWYRIEVEDQPEPEPGEEDRERGET